MQKKLQSDSQEIIVSAFSRIYIRNLRLSFAKLVIYEPEDDNVDEHIIHYDRHKEGINNILQLSESFLNRGLLKSFYTLKNYCKNSVKQNKTQKLEEKAQYHKRNEIPTFESLQNCQPFKTRESYKSSLTLGARKRSYKNLFEKTSAKKSPRYQYRSQAVLGF